ncbi:MAG: ISAzo13 family transposase, partial [Anaerolineales bacterium]
GRSWCQQAIEVNDHDFDQDALGKAVPYGIYDVNHNLGFVYVGRSATERRSHFADTPQFAVDVIAEWWQIEGRVLFPNQHKILILADAGGSNGCRPRLWKQQLQEQLADRLGLEVLVCHYPTGTSKWNPVEHRLFGPISINWAGKPLLTFETVLAYLRGTVTETGLQVKAFLIHKEYVKGLKVSKPVFQTLNIQFAEVCPRWNYTIRPHFSCTRI